MKTNWKKFTEVYNTCNKEYLEIGSGLPFGGIRVESIDPKGKRHSVVLTRDEFKKYFDVNTYKNATNTIYSPQMRMTQKPWYTYDDWRQLQIEELAALSKLEINFEE